jgi:UDPglucose--hexose-1-phosphate uridylyltransferase
MKKSDKKMNYPALKDRVSPSTSSGESSFNDFHFRPGRRKTPVIKIKLPSELRYDSVSRDWVVIATGRGKRPEFFKEKKRIKNTIAKAKCPFCNIETQEPPVLIYSGGKKVFSEKNDPCREGRVKPDIPKNWSTIVIPNKFPALLPCYKLEKKKEGQFYRKMNAVGFCELVVTKNHEKQFPHLKKEEVKQIFDAYHERYLKLMDRELVNYISIFYNHGAEAGASQSHPHSQIMTTPLIDVDLKNGLLNSHAYFQKNKKCIYCEFNKLDKKAKKRIVFENKYFLVICPFASKVAFQMIISPKKHWSNFERINDEEKEYLAEAFQKAMTALYKGLSDPAYNFYLHTAPCDGKDYSYYHWHWTIMPKTSIFAGFEMGARMEISTIEPEKAALYLRKQLKRK